ncbi:MAG TPA: hypothetical protein VFB69_03640 [Candidatus Dormibacteraeota bacterium]|nr:hypothetical protein [Candidatus Dormibacteraeota bacterium]
MSRFVGVALAIGALLAFAAPASAAGSPNLWPNGASGARANTEWRTNSYGGGLITRRTLIKAYMTTGQELLLGSSAIGQGLSDILVYNPNRVAGPIGTETIPATADFSCNTQRLAGGAPANQGIIASRAEELAGPDTIPTGGVTNGYVPCHYAAPSTGVYDVEFLGPAGDASAADAPVAADVALTNANDFNATQGTSIAAWDATVRSNLTSTADITGRVFTYYLALFTAGNGLPVFPTVYPVTLDGYRYRVDLRGMDPNGWVSYANQLGFLDSDGTTPLYHDAVAANTGSPGQLTSIQGGVTFALPSFPIFFEPPSAAATAALGIPATPTAPTISALSFIGNLGGNTSLVNTGGTFSFTTNVPGVYDIVISRDGVNFDPTLPANRSLRGARGAGLQTVSWDGNDNSGAAFPVGSYSVRASLHGGEYHFPMIDVENDTQGGPTITMQNPPGGTCPAITGGCSGAFYDDRAYVTLNGTTVDAGNTVGNVLCGLNPPATPNSDPVLGYNTTGVQRAFGAASGGNTNVPCTGSFGDAKGLDMWTYYPSSTVLAPVNIVAAAADIALTKSVSDATPAVGTNVTFTVTAHNNGPDDTTTLQVTDLLPAGLTFVSSSASTGTYTPGTGVWDIGVLANGATATLQITATVTGTTKVTNVATRSVSSPVDPVAANDTARSQVTGSTIPGLPNNGVPPIANLAPDVAGLLIVALVALGRRRATRAAR